MAVNLTTPETTRSGHFHTFRDSTAPGATKNSTSTQRGPDCLSGSKATQNVSASTRSPIGNSDKPARAATIFNHNGARPAQLGCLVAIEGAWRPSRVGLTPQPSAPLDAVMGRLPDVGRQG